MKANISRVQFFFLIPNLLFGKAIGITAGVIVRKIGADAWASMLFGFIIGTIIMVLLTILCRKFPDKTIIQYSQEILGKWAGKVIGIVLVIFFIFAFGTSASVMALHLSEYFLPNTPFFIICLIYILLCMYGVFLGIEVIVRFSLLGFVMLLLVNITMLIGTYNDFSIEGLMPILDKGILANMKNSVYVFSDLAMGILGVGVIYPMINNKKKTVPLAFWSFVVSALVIIIWPIFELGVMGPDIMEKYVVCCMQQVRNAQLTDYLPRYELLMVSFFAFSVYVQSVAMFFCAKHCFKQVTGIKKDAYIIIPLTIILIFVTYFMAKDDNSFINFLANPWSIICAILSIGLPLILFITALIRKKGSNDTQKKTTTQMNT